MKCRCNKATEERSHGTVCPDCQLWPDLCNCRPEDKQRLLAMLGVTTLTQEVPQT